ncbi:hypothetical protein FLK61_24625 [Paenalkalicoccus suaedae]|uniref:Uncharacterized protein n=1 Tax=Paenalkalicoccus suaedae TaxID=2592382 RepID=A0A859FBQ2_9BACI|nr:hypothetical protein [Paenalkalicoccus suaedae]QKS69964.1 hypothetical protein FLK61_24625 [Paenalkalicoccus suaedae]
MKRYIGTALLIFLVACGQGESSNTDAPSSSAAEPPNTESTENEDQDSESNSVQETISFDIPATDHDTIATLIREFTTTELSPDENADFYLEHEEPGREGNFVLLVTSDVEAVADRLQAFIETDTNAQKTQTIHIDKVEFSSTFLENAQARLYENRAEFLENEFSFFGSDLDVINNTVVLQVRTLEEVNMDALKEEFGQTDFLTFNESIVGDIKNDEISIPSEEPSFKGIIEEIDGTFVLINDEIYVSTSNATIIDPSGVIAPDDLKLGDQVNVWTTGAHDAVKPTRGSALFIQRVNE